VGHTRMEKINFSTRNVFGGIVGEKFNNKRVRPQFAESYYTVPLLEILQRNRAPQVIDYLSLDVEGAEHYIMQDFPFDQYTICVMTIERPNDPLQELLKSQGYQFLQTISVFGETLWAHTSCMDSLNMSSLPPPVKPRANLS
jgi:hypothetical protein